MRCSSNNHVAGSVAHAMTTSPSCDWATSLRSFWTSRAPSGSSRSCFTLIPRDQTGSWALHYRRSFLPPPVRLALAVAVQVRLTLEPLGALDAVEAAQAREVLGGLCLLPLCQMLRRLQVSLDLVDVSATQSAASTRREPRPASDPPGFAPRLGDGALVGDAHGERAGPDVPVPYFAAVLARPSEFSRLADGSECQDEVCFRASAHCDHSALACSYRMTNQTT